MGNGSRLLKKKMKKKIARKKSGDVGVFVAGRLLGRVETGDDVHHAASRGHGVIAKTLHEAADQHHVDELLVGASPIRGLSQFCLLYTSPSPRDTR